MPTALITGASKGFGRAIAEALADRGWTLIVDARTETELAQAARGHASITPAAGDVTDPDHRRQLAALVNQLGGRRLDLLINNASTLGTSPLPQLADYPLDDLRQVYETNVVAPLALIQAVIEPLTAAGGTIVNISSDAAVEAYPGWGGYGSAKAGLDQLTAVLAQEEPRLRCYAFDPGDMRTQMHQEAFPGEDISDRPEPQTVVPALLRLLDERPPSGRYRAAELTIAQEVAR
ncbi:MAG TPA: SDR family oxidoreductase [Streptosporangiaceae bacterium]|nr:SDR family oxidoreductase [Streptosporangiaceae bacterium]